MTYLFVHLPPYSWHCLFAALVVRQRVCSNGFIKIHPFECIVYGLTYSFRTRYWKPHPPRHQTSLREPSPRGERSLEHPKSTVREPLPPRRTVSGTPKSSPAREPLTPPRTGPETLKSSPVREPLPSPERVLKHPNPALSKRSLPPPRTGPEIPKSSPVREPLPRPERALEHPNQALSETGYPSQRGAGQSGRARDRGSTDRCVLGSVLGGAKGR